MEFNFAALKTVGIYTEKKITEWLIFNEAFSFFITSYIVQDFMVKFKSFVYCDKRTLLELFRLFL